MEEQLKAMDQVTATAIDLGMKFGPRLLVALLILAAGVYAGRWAGRATLGALARFQLDPPVRNLLERVVRIFVLAMFGIMALQNLGVEMLPLIAGLGVAGAGIALAMQGVLSNMMAGLTIIFTRPYRVGDFISIQAEEGEVLDVTLFTTVLGHPDLSRVVIPNRKIVGEILHNYGKLRQLAIEVGVAYGTDVNEALRAVDETLRANARILQDPKPVVGARAPRRFARGDCGEALGERARLRSRERRGDQGAAGGVSQPRHRDPAAAARGAHAGGVKRARCPKR
jgi:small conductance mechanosensitive channel